MRTLYGSKADREVIVRWCSSRHDGWGVPHRRETVAVEDVKVDLTYVGAGPAWVLRDRHRTGGGSLAARLAADRRDRFLPPECLGPATRAKLGVDLDVIDDAGHLAGDERPEAIADLFARLNSPSDHAFTDKDPSAP